MVVDVHLPLLHVFNHHPPWTGGIQNSVVLCLRPVVEVTPEAGSPEGISKLACILVQETLFIVKQGIQYSIAYCPLKETPVMILINTLDLSATVLFIV